MTTPSSVLRALPSVDRLLQDERVAQLVAEYSRPRVLAALRALLDERRRALQAGAAVPAEDLVPALRARLAAQAEPPLRRVINATGVIIHTNLGRAPLSADALAAMEAVGLGYSNLEYDLEAGERGSRHEHAVGLLTRLTGAGGALVVNNNAAAVLLALTALARGREVLISRGQLVEIGGGFRIPDVLRQSGAELVEVGTTNRTYARDYEAALSERTGAILRVHTSNFRVLGFVHAPELRELVAVGRRAGVPVIDDLGSGALLDTSAYGLEREPMVQESLAAGADLVCFSGDKLLGGPQAGIIVGEAGLVARLKQHPLTRAVRPDKLTIAALVATLEHYVRGEAEAKVPVWRMIAARPDELERRARALAERLPAALRAEVVAGASAVGGGSLPGETLPSRLLALDPPGGPERLADRLRRGRPPIVARIERGRLLLDLRTVLPEEDELVAGALARLGAEPDGSDAAGRSSGG